MSKPYAGRGHYTVFSKFPWFVLCTVNYLVIFWLSVARSVAWKDSSLRGPVMCWVGRLTHSFAAISHSYFDTETAWNRNDVNVHFIVLLELDIFGIAGLLAYLALAVPGIVMVSLVWYGPALFRQPNPDHSFSHSSQPNSLSSSVSSTPVSLSVTPTLFHSKLRMYLFLKSFDLDPTIDSHPFHQTAFTDAWLLSGFSF